MTNTAVIHGCFLSLEYPPQCFDMGAFQGITFHTYMKHALCSCVSDFHDLYQVMGVAPADDERDHHFF